VRGADVKSILEVLDVTPRKCASFFEKHVFFIEPPNKYGTAIIVTSGGRGRGGGGGGGGGGDDAGGGGG
jgi:hypothetical protein